jgi:sulfopyruvate decarboxylase subunit alpha
MAKGSERTLAVAEGLDALKLDFLAYTPSNSIAPIIDYFRLASNPNHLKSFPVSREEEAVGIIGAVSFAGKQGAIIMQDNGFGNSLTALTTFALSYRRPLLIVANTRGGLGEYNSMIHSISEGVPDMLKAARIPVVHLDRRTDPTDWRAAVFEAGLHARMTHRPVVVLMEFWDGTGKGLA